MKLNELKQTFNDFLKEEIEPAATAPEQPTKPSSTEVSVDSYGDMSPEELKNHSDHLQRRLLDIIYNIDEKQLGMTKQEFFRLVLNYGMAYYVYGIKRGSDSIKDLYDLNKK